MAQAPRLPKRHVGTSAPRGERVPGFQGHSENLGDRGFRLGRLALALVALGSCGRGGESTALRELGGDAVRGVVALQQYSCASCHHIPGIVGATTRVGPSLGGISRRKYIAGVLPNTPDNMLRWLQDPVAIAPRSAMPNLGVSERDARDIAAYLYRLD
ncbi:c-type cytochrome [Methylotetracoccus oryzae]|uniref:c-type cytochrome n=1 Tax=Methylotetracoccus oryzae TaxID=1919059 RepID=UPI00111B7C4B|nr:c-type cytochrome [Methylotetracoccus oryzae]